MMHQEITGKRTIRLMALMAIIIITAFALLLPSQAFAAENKQAQNVTQKATSGEMVTEVKGENPSVKVNIKNFSELLKYYDFLYMESTGDETKPGFGLMVPSQAFAEENKQAQNVIQKVTSAKAVAQETKKLPTSVIGKTFSLYLIGKAELSVERGSEYKDPGVRVHLNGFFDCLKYCDFLYMESTVDTEKLGVYYVKYTLIDKEIVDGVEKTKEVLLLERKVTVTPETSDGDDGSGSSSDDSGSSDDGGTTTPGGNDNQGGNQGGTTTPGGNDNQGGNQGGTTTPGGNDNQGGNQGGTTTPGGNDDNQGGSTTPGGNDDNQGGNVNWDDEDPDNEATGSDENQGNESQPSGDENQSGDTEGGNTEDNTGDNQGGDVNWDDEDPDNEASGK